MNTRTRVVLGILAGSLTVVPVAGAATSPFVKLPKKWGQGPVVVSNLVGNTAYVVSAGTGANFALGRVTKLTTGRVKNGRLALAGSKSLGYTASYTGAASAFVGSSIFVQRPDFTIQVASLSASGKVGGLKTSPIAATANGVLTGGVEVGSRPVLAFTQTGFGLCCSTAGTPSALGAFGTSYPNDVVVGADRHGHVQVAWLDYANEGSTIRTIELDHATLLPKTAASTVLSGPKQIDTTTFSMVVACGAVCHVVYGNGLNVYSWAPGDARPRKIVGNVNLLAGAAVDAKGRLLTAYVKSSKLVVQRGNATGKGGKTTSALIPATGNLSLPSVSFSSSNVLVAMAEQFGGTFQTVAGVLPLP